MTLTHSQRRALHSPLWSRAARKHWGDFIRLGIVRRADRWNRGKWRWTTAATQARTETGHSQ